MKSNLLLILIGLSLLWITSSCGGKEHSEQSSESDYSDFQSFYQRFHTDSIYQIEHIIFPLEGYPPEVDSTTVAEGTFRWKKSEWKMQREFNQTESGFKIELIPLSKDLIIEKILHKSGQFGIVRRFARIGDEWHLIYYAGLNKIRQPGETMTG